MEGVAWCANAMKAAQARLDVAADNLANAQTNGFRRHVVSFELGSGGLRSRDVASGGAGALRMTGRAFDLAVVGHGGLHVAALSSANAQRAPIELTRGGSFARSAQGYLIDGHGRALLGEHGFVRLSDERATIALDGAIVVDGRTLDRLAAVPGTRVQSGALEGANVDSIREMVSIVEAQRSFETAQKALTSIDSARSKAINDMGKIQ